MEAYILLSKVGQGTYGTMYKGEHKATKKIVAIKKTTIPNTNEPITSSFIREYTIMSNLSHPNIVSIEHVICEYNKQYIVMEYIEFNLYEYFPKMSADMIKRYIKQLLEAISYCHSRGVIHRDLKPNNILVDAATNTLKLCDFGMARHLSIPLQPLTPNVCTLQYRCPEMLLGATLYGAPLDMWSIGCIFVEMFSKRILFHGSSDIDQLFVIFQQLGTPDQKLWNDFALMKHFEPHFPHCVKKTWQNISIELHNTPLAVDLVEKMLCYDPKKRITAEDALLHEYFDVKTV